MRRLKKPTFLTGLTVSLLASVVPLQASSAAANGNPFVATPFVAATDANTTDLSSTVVTAAGSPFSVSVNKSAIAKGEFAGIVLDPQALDQDFQNISFLLSGAESTQVVVHSQARGTRILRVKGVSAKEGMKSGSSSSGYRLVKLNADQFGISTGDAVDQIVISTDQSASQPSFTVKDIQVDGTSVSKSLEDGTHYFPVLNGISSGLSAVISSQVGGLPTTPTNVSVTNSTSNQQQYFYINLLLPSATSGYPADEEIQSLSDISTAASGPNVTTGEGQITQFDSTHGYFFLNPSDTVTFTTSPNSSGQYLAFSAQIFTNGTSTNNSQCITDVTQGVGVGATFAEFTINADISYINPDTVDISEVNGVNALYQITLPTSTTYGQSFCSGAYLYASKTRAGQYITVPSIANQPGPNFPFTNDSTVALSKPSQAEYFGPKGHTHIYGHGTVGVYPFGCDLCTALHKPGCMPSSLYAGTVPQTAPICQVGRIAANLGGTINIALTAFPYGGVGKRRK